ncbi:MAG: PEP-CTERM sorting domain-containing protein [Snowella sp.]
MDGSGEAEANAAVPEPLTILGATTAVGFGAFFKRKRKLSESSEKDNTKDS